MRVHIAAIAIVTRLDCAWKPHFKSQAKKDSKNRLVYGLLKRIVNESNAKKMNKMKDIYSWS